MIILKRLALVTGATFAVCAWSSPASAQASRTWVSGVGDDVNPCSRTAPCKTFAGAISKTASGGEINCLDPGGFGSVTITKPLAIVCDYTGGGVLSGGHGISVLLGPGGGQVFLSGLDIFAAPSDAGPSSGVVIRGAALVHIRNSAIRGFRSGAGIDARDATQVLVTGTTISGNQTGILTAGAGNGQVIVERSTIIGNDTGLSAGGAKIVSAGDNLVAVNGSEGRFSSTVQRK